MKEGISEERELIQKRVRMKMKMVKRGGAE